MNWGAVFANGSTPETARRSELSTESTFSAENANDEDRCSAHNLESKPFCYTYTVSSSIRKSTPSVQLQAELRRNYSQLKGARQWH